MSGRSGRRGSTDDGVCVSMHALGESLSVRFSNEVLWDCFWGPIYTQMSLVWLEYLAGVVPPFTMMHVSRERGVSVTIVNLWAWQGTWVSYRQLTAWTKSFYFVLHFFTLKQWPKEATELTTPNSLKRGVHYADRPLQGEASASGAPLPPWFCRLQSLEIYFKMAHSTVGKYKAPSLHTVIEMLSGTPG